MRRWMAGKMLAVLVLAAAAEMIVFHNPVYAGEGQETVLTYEGLEERIKNFSPQVKSARVSLEQLNAVYEEAIGELMDQRQKLRTEAKELKKEGNTETSKHYEKQAKVLKESADRLKKQIRSKNSASQTMDIGKTEDQTLMSAQDLMMSWHSVNLDLESARCRSLQAEYEMEQAERKLGLGLGTAMQAQEAKSAFQEAKAQEQALEDTLAKLKGELCLITGYDSAIPLVIGELPQPDRQRAGSLNLEEDKKKAWGNNYELRSQRRSGYSGTNRQVHSQKQMNRWREESLYEEVTSLYEKVQVALAGDQEAELGLQEQERAWEKAQKEQELGISNQGEFLQAKAEYVQAKTRRGQAAIELLQALEHYQWTVKGLDL